MTIAVDLGRKATKQTNKRKVLSSNKINNRLCISNTLPILFLGHVSGNGGTVVTLVNVYVDLVVFTHIAGTS